MTVIGLTGPTGSGKSTVAGFACERGFCVIDCDLVSREVTKKGNQLLSVLSTNFGSEIIKSDGSLDRKALAKKAFADKESTERLNAVMLPCIVSRINEIISEIDAKQKLVLLDAPTLFESGLDSACDSVIALLCDEDMRRRRITVRDGLSGDDAALRLSASKPDSFYIGRTPNIIYNRGNMDELRRNAFKMLDRLVVPNE